MSKMILSLDGGGIRGAAAAQFLLRVEETLNGDHDTTIRDCVDLYAGTSTGSLIALGLATTSLAMEDIAKLYDADVAEVIFAENRGFFERDGFNAPKYEGRQKTEEFERILESSTTIGDVPDGKHVVVVTYAVERRCPMVIKSTDIDHRGLLAYQVADASSAAPTYFPTAQLEIPDEPGEVQWLVDGGVVANNPTMCAICEVPGAWPGTGLADTRVLSVGTGSMTRKVNGAESRKWGCLGWFMLGHIFDIITDEKIVAYQAKQVLAPGNYIRVNAELRAQPGFDTPPDDSMDDITRGNIHKLKALGDFWYDAYGAQAVELLLGSYDGVSLDRIDPRSGKPT